jgi:hypothetical protein
VRRSSSTEFVAGTWKIEKKKLVEEWVAGLIHRRLRRHAQVRAVHSHIPHSTANSDMMVISPLQ